jgi:23S rRNA (cytosine1962-C5)-methyltransferase
MKESLNLLKPYQLLDSGEGRKLERLGDIIVERQSNVALWKKSLPASDWNQVSAIHHRSENGAGRWELKKKIPEFWMIRHGDLKLKVKLTGFGHLGFFPEVLDQWVWFRKSAETLCLKKRQAVPRIINLFGYTGGTSMALALGGAEVTHVDAAKGIVDWGKEMAALNEVPNGKLRWIVDDCIEFLKREARRGKKYDGAVMDPPSFGRGPNKEVWKIEEHMSELLDALKAVLVEEPELLHFSSHSSGFTPEVLKNLLTDIFDISKMKVEQGEMFIPEVSGKKRNVPSGTFCRLLAK